MEKTNILVVDDEKEIADLLELYLISDGYQVKKAYTAMDGLRMIQQESIDLSYFFAHIQSIHFRHHNI